MFNTVNFYLVAVVMTLATLNSAQATLIVQDATLDHTNLYDHVSFEQFNPNLGELTGVTMYVDSLVTFNVTEELPGCTLGTSGCWDTATFTYNLIGAPYAYPHSNVISYNMMDVERALLIQGVNVSFTVSELVTFSDIEAFKNGSHDTPLYSLRVWDNGLNEQIVSAYANISLKYEYNSVTQSVPEPTTLAIFALGMIGLASRRFKKQS